MEYVAWKLMYCNIWGIMYNSNKNKLNSIKDIVLAKRHFKIYATESRLNSYISSKDIQFEGWAQARSDET